MSGEDEFATAIQAYFVLIALAFLILLVLGVSVAIWIVLKAIGANRRLRSVWELVGVAISGLVAAGLLFFTIGLVPTCLSSVSPACIAGLLAGVLPILIFGSIAIVLASTLGALRRTH